MSCKDRMHDLLAEELMNAAPEDWKGAMERSFLRMDGEVAVTGGSEPMEASCRCERQMPHCDAVGSTAVVAVVSPEKIVVGNCGDSRAILCRNGKPVPLTSDHKVSLLRTRSVRGFSLCFFYLTKTLTRVD